ncbi:Catenin alpha-3 [Acipenser ruthenus]|uniref:Catenin alpha-3 n=1 Tax=Acipenser ruthenus TaxID=7906 RepID=A0A444V7L8_ACIRT|nr:Catenin alpha-3 [Acipenser ruthenus]
MEVEEFQKLQQAKEILKNEDSRARYDYWRRNRISIPFRDWEALSDAVKASMHWAVRSKNEPMLEAPGIKDSLSPGKPPDRHGEQDCSGLTSKMEQVGLSGGKTTEKTPEDEEPQSPKTPPSPKLRISGLTSIRGTGYEECRDDPYDINEVTTLVNCPKYPSNNKKGRSKRGRVLLKSVEEATLNLIEKGEKIARDTAVLKEELTAAVEEVRRESISLTRTAREFTEDPCHLSKREAVVQAARALLAAVTRLLILADIIDVIFLLQYLTTVQKTFDFLRTTSNKAELKKANQKFVKELELLDKLAYKRQQIGNLFPFLSYPYAIL